MFVMDRHARYDAIAGDHFMDVQALDHSHRQRAVRVFGLAEVPADLGMRGGEFVDALMGKWAGLGVFP